MPTNIFLSLALLLLAAKVFGELFERLKMSSLAGEVVGGVIVGPLLGFVQPDEFLRQIAGFGILFMLFIIGLSTKFEDVKGDIYKGSILAFAGGTLSLVSGVALGMLLFGSLVAGIVIGVALISTSTAVTLRSFIDMKEQHSRAFKMALAVDMADEVMAILSLSLLTTYLTLGSVRVAEIFSLFLAVIGFFLLILTVGAKIVGQVLLIFQRMRDEHILVSMPIVIVFIIAFISENVGVAAVSGAFLAGLAMNRSPLTETVIVPKMKTIGYGLFIPIFFAYSALVINISSLIQFLAAIILLLLAGSLAKFLGTGILSRYFGFSGREQRLIGIGMIPRGEYSIIIAQLALVAGAITAHVYTIIVAVVVLSIIATPALFIMADRKRFF
jgi:Kef-type K+ transport system membrane component KefB